MEHRTVLFLVILPISKAIDSTGGFSVKNNYIVVYLYVDDKIYENFFKRYNYDSIDGWANLAKRSISDDNKIYFENALYHELEH
jgi:hypothetical protein